jgi:signal transduction histidine kinase
MPSDDNPLNAEREQTDESLRAEREKADLALGAELSIIDETADAVITKARARADEVLAAARAKVDRRSALPSPTVIAEQRVREDAAVKAERADADETVREERAEHLALLAVDRKETDEDLVSERAQSDDALAARDEFLGIVSHDLRNLLNTMNGFASLIASVASTENRGPEIGLYAQRIQRSGARMNRLIGDLVDIASIEAGKLRVTREIGDPTHVLAEAVEALQLQASASGISLTSEIASPLPPVAFDPARILQVVTNLLSNAIKFTPANGKVSVRAERVEVDVRFCVSDTGVGIPADKLEAIFDRFLQLNANDRRGVGLGLYISKCIVQGHGGRIWAESKVGEGATFFLTLPVHGDR